MDMNTLKRASNVISRQDRLITELQGIIKTQEELIQLYEKRITLLKRIEQRQPWQFILAAFFGALATALLMR